MYLFILSATGVLDNFGLPPRLVLLIVMPAVAGIVFFSGRKSFRVILQRTSLHLPVYLQSFRIMVELLIYGAFLQGVFPERATFKGLNYDILVGISSLIMGVLVQTAQSGSNRVADMECGFTCDLVGDSILFYFDLLLYRFFSNE